VVKLGMMRALVIGAFAVLFSNLIFAWLTTQGHSLPALFVAIGVDNTLGGISGTCLIAYMSSLTSSGFTATQYALFTSLYALPGKLVASQSGRIVEASARAAEGNGPLSSLKGLFGSMTPESLVSGAQKANVSPAALGAGYFTFFLYSSLIGVAAVVLTFMVVRRQAPKASEA
jgi:PAT family beta-lactamase induction signal transducer AmpG